MEPLGISSPGAPSPGGLSSGAKVGIAVAVVVVVIAAIVLGVVYGLGGDKYKCTSEGNCAKDPSGKYASMAACAAVCGKPAPPSAFERMATTAAPGTGVLEAFQNVGTGVVDWHTSRYWPNHGESHPNKKRNPEAQRAYSSLVTRKSFASPRKPFRMTSAREKLLAYLTGVLYATDKGRIQRLTTEQLAALYRSLVFLYITTEDTQPDGTFYGTQWEGRILDDGPRHSKSTGMTNMTATRNESFLFDQLMTHRKPFECPGYRKERGRCPEHAKFFGNRFFPEMVQSTLRRGMRNSPQVLAELPPWAPDGGINDRYGTGGFPANALVECLQFPQEHGAGGWPSGCDAARSKCDIEGGRASRVSAPRRKSRVGWEYDLRSDQWGWVEEDGAEKFPFAPRRPAGEPSLDAAAAALGAGDPHPAPRFQPHGKDRSAGGDPFCGEKPQWFYYSQGNGMFWNIGETGYCYNYVDIFLNAPMGVGANKPSPGSSQSNAVGWSSGFAQCSDDTPFPPGGGVLGPCNPETGAPVASGTVPTEHDYNDPCYSMKLLLEFASRVDVPGGCRDPSGCHPGLKDARTGLRGIGFCAAQQRGGPCPCHEQTDTQKPGDARCLFKYCKADQPINGRRDSFHAQAEALMNVRHNSFWEPYQESMRTEDRDNFDPNPAWAAVRVKSCPKSAYPDRSSHKNRGHYELRDKRYFVTGWVNGHFYGYPEGHCMAGRREYGTCRGEHGYNPMKGGIPGTDPKTGEVIYGKHFTRDDPLVYVDMRGEEIYRTWYGKEMDCDEETAMRLMAEFYSCGDCGLDNMEINWPFGCYFGYGQALGSPGKAATNKLSCVPYACTTVQFTMTATAYGRVVQPAFDFEILYIPPVKTSSSFIPNCVCATAVTVDLTADFDDEEDPGRDLKRYACLNKGSTGGYVPADSPAGRSAVAFQGQRMGVTNWTTLGNKTGTFNPYLKNKYGVDSRPEWRARCARCQRC